MNEVTTRSSNVENQRPKVPDVPYQSTVKDTMRFHAITMMKVNIVTVACCQRFPA